MTISAVAFSDTKNSRDAGLEIAEQINTTFTNKRPQAVIVFASSVHDYKELVSTIQHETGTGVIVGCSSAGEFMNSRQQEGAVSAVAIHSDEMLFRASLATGLSDNIDAAVDAITADISPQNPMFMHRSALLLVDALSGQTDYFIEQLNERTAGLYQFFGGGAGDDAKFTQTHVFMNEQVVTDGAVMLEILSKKPIGVGVHHGWVPTGTPMRVTAAEGMRLLSLNTHPAVDAFREHARATGQTFDLTDPLPFFLHNVIGIETPQGYKLRVPLHVHEDGSISTASDIPAGSIVHFMKTETGSAKLAAERATEAALAAIELHKPELTLFFDCVATRIRLGREFVNELGAVSDKLKDSPLVGCNTYGQVARVDGQFSGFHNCTAVVCVFPQ